MPVTNHYCSVDHEHRQTLCIHARCRALGYKKFDSDEWARNEYEFVRNSEGPHYSWEEFQWDLAHSSFYQDDGDDAPWPGLSRGANGA